MPSSTVSSVNAVSSRASPIDRRIGEVEVGPAHRCITHRQTPPVGLEPSARRDREVRLVDRAGPDREVRMEPDAERRRRGRTVRRHRGDLEAIGRHPVLHLEVDPPREGGLLGHDASEGHRVGRSRDRVPHQPPDETVDRVRVFRFVQCCDPSATVELVGPVLEAVGPRRQHLSTARRGRLVDREPIEHVVAIDPV